MSSKIFRKVSLERLSSPEQLDQMVTITTPGGRLALGALGLLLALVVAWGILGEIPTTAAGGGILIKTGGVINVASSEAGQLDAVYVREGDRVAKGQTIARIAQPRLVDEIQALREALAELKGREQQLMAFGSANLKLRLESIAKELDNLRLSIAAGEERQKWMNEKIGIQNQLLDEGLITKQALNDTRTELAELNLEIEGHRSQIKKLAVEEKELKNQREQQQLGSQEAVNEATRALELKEAELQQASRVVSSHSGVVIEVRRQAGNVISAGAPLLTLELTGEDIQDVQALIYLPPDLGKQVTTGMEIRISPETVRREEYGYMLGIVTSVAEYPSSREGMMRYLENETLVDRFTGNGAPIAVMADLIPDPNTTSGFKWSSPKGPPTRVYSGTGCLGSVELRSQAPISLVIPYLKKQAGLD